MWRPTASFRNESHAVPRLLGNKSIIAYDECDAYNKYFSEDLADHLGKMLSGIQEVRARGARTICLAEEGDEAIEPYADVLIRLPTVPVLLQPLVAVIPLQLFACELATVKGHDVDQPRNLAKSVTVE